MEIVTRIPRMREISRSLRAERAAAASGAGAAAGAEGGAATGVGTGAGAGAATGAAAGISPGAPAASRRLAFVPTMGALHEGHLALVRRAREVSNTVILSIFVNPKQFGPGEDFERYPRDLTRDAGLAVLEGVEYVFAPSVEDMYPPGFSTVVEVEGLSRVMCGASRPEHFRGVTAVVLKLLEIVSPDVAIFGAKDYQQFVIIRRMVRDLNLDVELILAPIVRELDGLAMSSRNAYLSPAERRAAVVLRGALDEAERLFAAGERDAATIEKAVRQVIERQPLARIDYVEVVEPEMLAPVVRLTGETLVALGVWIGDTRLIDNTLLKEVLK